MCCFFVISRVLNFFQSYSAYEGAEVAFVSFSIYATYYFSVYFNLANATLHFLLCPLVTIYNVAGKVGYLCRRQQQLGVDPLWFH